MNIEEIILRRTCSKFLKGYIEDLIEKNNVLKSVDLAREELYIYDNKIYNKKIIVDLNTLKYYINNDGWIRAENRRYNSNSIDAVTMQSKLSKPYLSIGYHYYEYDKVKENLTKNKNDKWDFIGTLKNGMGIIKKDDKYGIIKIISETDAEVLIEPKNEYKEFNLLPEYTVTIKDENNYIALFNKNKFIVNFEDKLKVDEIYLLNKYCEYYLIKKDDKYGIMDRNGEIVLEPIYDSLNMVFPNIIETREDEKYSDFPLVGRIGEKTYFYDEQLNLIIMINSDYKILGNYVLYKKNKSIHIFDIKNKKDKKIANTTISLYNEKKVAITTVLNDIDNYIYNYPYYELDDDQIILHKSKKYGIKILSDTTNTKEKRYLDTQKELEKVELYIYKELLYPDKKLSKKI